MVESTGPILRSPSSSHGSLILSAKRLHSQWVQVPKPDAKSTYGMDCRSEDGRAHGLAPAATVVTPGCVRAAICPPGGERSATDKRTKVRNVAVRRIAFKDWTS